jgi:hypothetical protein
MKTKLIFIIIFSFASVYSYTQTERKYIRSLELGFNNHYLLSNTYNTDFNYGVSFVHNWNWEKFRLSFGINYSTFNWCFECKPYCRQDLLYKRSYKMKYLSFPISGAYTFHKTEKFSYGIAASFIASKALPIYSIVDSYIDKDDSKILINNEKDFVIEIDKLIQFDFSYRIGPELSYRLSERSNLRFMPYFEHKILYNMKYIIGSHWEYYTFGRDSFIANEFFYYFDEPKYVFGFNLSIDFLMPSY